MGDMLRTIRWLLVCRAIIGAVFAAGFYLTRRANTDPNTGLLITALLGLDAALYLVFGWALGWRTGWVLVLALLFLAANAVLTLTGRGGLFAVVVLLMDVVIGVLLLTCWRAFFPARET